MVGFVTVERTIVVRATRKTLLPYIAQLPRWAQWSPWEKSDSSLAWSYSGVAGDVGSTYAWRGNRRTGAGWMRIEAVEPDDVRLEVLFSRPFKSRSTVSFKLITEGDSTQVIWSMMTERTFMTRFCSLDRLVGPDLEKGLEQLRELVETRVSRADR